MNPKILLLSGYDAASHLYWREHLQQRLPQFDWVQLSLPARHFAWRTRGSSLSFAFQHAAELNQSFDLLIVTSMVDLASLRGFCPQLAKVPTILYFHENQFVYPVDKHQPNIVNAQLTSIYSALCADRIVFNSAYNRGTFFLGANQLLKKLPDGVPAGLLDLAETKSQVLPVPIELPTERLQDKIVQFELTDKSIPVHIVWNHRWEYDKQPEVFFKAIKLLKAQGMQLQISVLGQSFRQVPECFAIAKQQLTTEIVNWGYQPHAKYQQILQTADIVVSSALHDFQGLSMMEAIASGCIPVAPDRVAYPEYLSAQNLYSVADTIEQEAQYLADKLRLTILTQAPCIPDIHQFASDNLLPQYAELFRQLID